jgi:predicted DNA-binding transcriptional regulator YafY
MMANTLVRYHGSKVRYQGHIMRVLGRCYCARHPQGQRRYRLAWRGENELLLQCVREGSITRVTVAEADATVDARVVETAIDDERPLLIDYVAADGEYTRRVIEPYELDETAAGYALVRAMDRRSGQPRSFRLDRVTSLTVQSGPFLLDRPLAVTAAEEDFEYWDGSGDAFSWTPDLPVLTF